MTELILQFNEYSAALDKLNNAFELIQSDVQRAGMTAGNVVVPRTRWVELSNLEFLILTAKNAIVDFARAERNGRFSDAERDEFLQSLLTRINNANMARAGFRAAIRARRAGV